jgi:glycosyltransferase involved in cell wall biosynthesis
MNSPLVSVVMSVYNTEKYLTESINSILNQTYTDFEFIIVNDGSNDNSLEIINSFHDTRIVIINQSNTGLAKALNNGIKLAKGKYIARMDADDISNKDRIEKQVVFLNENPQYVVIGSNATFIDMQSNRLYDSNYFLNDNEIRDRLPLSPFFHSSTMFKKNIFEEIGGYNEKIKHHFEDRILWNQMAKLGKLGNLPETLISYRLVPNSISNKKSEKFKIFDEICNKIIETGNVTEKDLKIISKLSESQTDSEKLANYHLRLGKIYLENNFNRQKAIFHLTKTLSIHFFNKVAIFNLFLCVTPRWLIYKWKKSRGVIL